MRIASLHVQYLINKYMQGAYEQSEGSLFMAVVITIIIMRFIIISFRNVHVTRVATLSACCCWVVFPHLWTINIKADCLCRSTTLNRSTDYKMFEIFDLTNKQTPKYAIAPLALQIWKWSCLLTKNKNKKPDFLITVSQDLSRAVNHSPPFQFTLWKIQWHTEKWVFKQ